MPTLLRRRKRTEEADNQPVIEQEQKSRPQTPRDLFLLVPADGGLSFRLFTFSGPSAAAAHLATLGIQPGSKPGYVAFRALNAAVLPGGDDPLEAVVLISDADRPGIVDLYSFIDMDSANTFVQQEAERGLDMAYVAVHWAAPVDLTLVDEAFTHTEEEEQPVVPAFTVPIPPRPNGATPAPAPAPVAAAAATPPAAPETARKRQPAKQPAKAAPDTRVRVPVTSAGAVFEPAPPAPKAAAGTERNSATGLLADIQAWGGWDGLAPLLINAALTNQTTYEEFERDPFAGGRARLIVALAAIAAAFGAMNGGLTSVMAHLPFFVLGWGAFVYTVYAVGTGAFPGHRDERTFRRLSLGLALATAPALLLVLGVVPTFGPLFVLGAYVWILLTTTAAIGLPLELNRDLSLIVATVGCLALFTVSQVVPLVLF